MSKSKVKQKQTRFNNEYLNHYNYKVQKKLKWSLSVDLKVKAATSEEEVQDGM